MPAILTRMKKPATRAGELHWSIMSSENYFLRMYLPARIVPNHIALSAMTMYATADSAAVEARSLCKANTIATMISNEISHAQRSDNSMLTPLPFRSVF